MRPRRLGIPLLLAMASMVFAHSCRAQEGSEPAAASPPAAELVGILWSGREVVFTPRPDDLAARGLTIDDLAGAFSRRFEEGAYVIGAAGESLDLAQVAGIEVRDLVAPPFEVALEDGRRVRVSPSPERVMRYLVTGRYFENVVRSKLRYRAEFNPAATIVLDRIPVPGGQIPNMFTREHVHYSLGEPLDAFGEVEILVPAGQVPPPFCNTAEVTDRDRWLPVHSGREVRLLVTFVEYAGGLNPDRTLPVIPLSFDPRFSYRVTIDEVVLGDPEPFAPGAEVIFQVHSPARDLRLPEPAGERLVLVLREVVEAGGRRGYTLLRAMRPEAAR